MSKLDDPSYKEVCRLADECGLAVELHSTQSMSKIPVLTLKILNKKGKILTTKTQFRQESIDSMASVILQRRATWATTKK